MSDLKRTGLYDLHLELGAKMVPFAGYEMPVQYPAGVMKEHIHTRENAGLFDVSHMGQVLVRPKSGDVADAALAFETLVPVSLLALKEGRQRYAMFTNDAGGIMDDLMVANRGDHLFVVVNAACKEADIAHMRANLSDSCDIEVIGDRALLALQGPLAEAALNGIAPVADMKFMDVAMVPSEFGDLWVSRSGYTGEDGLEISVVDDRAVAFARALLAAEGVEPIGLGARDSLRLEAGLCLYGNDIDETTSPVEAALEWAMQKVRRKGGAREGGFPGADRILNELENGTTRRRVGILPEGRAPMRAHTLLFASEDASEPMGEVTSGAFGPTIARPMSMGYVATEFAETGTRIFAEVRGKRLPATIADMPFRPSTYKR
ncbi:glycine cleavage system aminomethyltransferase GcvT [Profundibacter amoris]|uniref:aminomethyltransferase n=1 Tax=Profundibacter amoris TaxID=2171755 RepID=A0A347ULV6_9RHOB|nr:glycine cleavage system aminomethyltransferase GcvT [Profundibacter amoris]AXX99834.1 glycine cleavage system aminomethyltransferase GcvT [Profundibacter amoris]